MTVKIIKLISGEELVAKVEEDGDTLKLFDIIILVPFQMEEEGKATIMFLPWLAHADTEDGVNVSNRHIICTVKPRKEIENKYRQVTSGIVTPETELQF